MIRRFLVTANGDMDFAELVLEIDMDHPNIMKNLQDMVEFWSGGKRRIIKHNGDIVLAFVEQISEKIFAESIYKSLNEIVRMFSRDEFSGGEEGYDPIDGSCGITLTELSPFEPDVFVTIKELTK